MKHSKLLEKIEALEKRIDVLEKKAAAGTATEFHLNAKDLTDRLFYSTDLRLSESRQR